MKKLLFLCTGNTCRSPMAGALAGFLHQELYGEEDPLEIETAGLAAFPGAPASPHAITVMKERGLDLSPHRAKLVTRELVEWADLILTMTGYHKDRLLAQYPDAQGKVFTLGEYAAGSSPGAPGTPGVQGEDIADPFGGSEEDYRQTAGILEEVLRAVLSALRRQN